MCVLIAASGVVFTVEIRAQEGEGCMSDMHSDLSKMPLIGWIALAVLLFSQSIWLFNDAQRRNRNPWFWGVWGLIQCPTPLVVYFIVVRKILKNKKFKNKNKKMKK